MDSAGIAFVSVLGVISIGLAVHSGRMKGMVPELGEPVEKMQPPNEVQPAEKMLPPDEDASVKDLSPVSDEETTPPRPKVSFAGPNTGASGALHSMKDQYPVGASGAQPHVTSLGDQPSANRVSLFARRRGVNRVTSAKLEKATSDQHDVGNQQVANTVGPVAKSLRTASNAQPHGASLHTAGSASLMPPLANPKGAASDDPRGVRLDAPLRKDPEPTVTIWKLNLNVLNRIPSGPIAINADTPHDINITELLSNTHFTGHIHEHRVHGYSYTENPLNIDTCIQHFYESDYTQLYLQVPMGINVIDIIDKAKKPHRNVTINLCAADQGAYNNINCNPGKIIWKSVISTDDPLVRNAALGKNGEIEWGDDNIELNLELPNPITEDTLFGYYCTMLTKYNEIDSTLLVLYESKCSADMMMRALQRALHETKCNKQVCLWLSSNKYSACEAFDAPFESVYAS